MKFILFLIISINLYCNNKLMTTSEIINKYHNIKGLNKKLDLKIFIRAMNGYIKISKREKDILTIIDYSKPSLEKRFFVIDLKREKLLYLTYVMHGKNSGDNYTNKFSNIINSYKSSPGFYETLNSYEGQYGYSLRINGLEKNINDNAMKRNIVIHGSKYASPLPNTLMLSKSLGCPAIPQKLSKSIINTIKNGSIIYIHTNKEEYLNITKI